MGLPNPALSARARILSAATIFSLAVATLVATVALPANADTTPADTSTPSTVTADALPTAQINGVAWSQVIIGNTVYVGGSFSTARPAGSAAGANTVTRTNLLAYNLTTGALLSWAPTVNAQVRSLAASPDGTRLYVGGDFTTINGVTKNRIAAFDVATGNLNTAFTASANGQVHAVAATNSTVYFGGPFTQAKSVARAGAAAALATNGNTTAWAPVVAGDAGYIYALTVSPDGSKVVLGGSFSTINGSSNPGYGLAEVDGTLGTLGQFDVNSTVRNAGKNSAIFSLTSDADSVYGTGYVFGAGGNLEGSFRASWATGATTWIEDCHGDSYSVAVNSSVVYIASHSHYCGNIGAFPQTDPTWTFHRATAYDKNPSTTNVITADPYGYYNFAGQTTTTQLDWYPTINTGTYTGQAQGAWSVAANDQYSVYGGEFTSVNGVAQQGLVRFAVKSIAPNKVGPTALGNQFIPTVDSPAAGTARVSWTANWDMDNENLTYQVFRNNSSTPIYTTTGSSTFWDRPNMIFVDKGLTPGATYTYKIKAVDPSGNIAAGSNASVVISATGTLSDYATAVLQSQPTSYFRLGAASGATSTGDSAGTDTTTTGTGVTFGTTGAIPGDSDTAATFDGTSNGLVASNTLAPAPNTFTLEGWFKTTSTAGGKIVGYGNTNTGNSGNYDRSIYMNGAGKVKFGVYDGNTEIVASSKSYNDGNWHYVVASMSSAGMQLNVDGKSVGSNASITRGLPYSGYWRIGGDSTWEGANYFAGSIDDVAIYPNALSQSQIVDHYTAAGGKYTAPVAPADAYGKSVFAQNPLIYYRLDEASGTTATDASPAGNNGTYYGTYTQGVSGAIDSNADTATKFGDQGVVSSNDSFVNPTTYSTQVWFKTTTTNGGKLTGFGNAQSGTSSGYDRHVYMQNDGKLVFGTYTGQENVATSDKSYNDGKWHEVVATESSAGMKLYVDGAVVATNSQTSAENSTGYWRVGGDTTWGSNSPWFDGTLDEFAVYGTALSASVIANQYALGVPANKTPTAAFTSTTNAATVSTDATNSTDSDGTVASYSWNWGDGSALDTGVTATHTYAASGNYTVTLTVTDDGGATDTKTASVVATLPNVAPTAAFTSTVSNLSVAFNGNTSTDSDGHIAAWAWDFGDGTTATGATTTHTYATAGTFTATLTVTDDGGLTNVATQSVTTVAPPANVAPTAAFTATVNATTKVAAFDASASADSDGTVASYAWNFGDGTTGTGVKPNHTYTAAGSYSVVLTVTDNSGATGTVTNTVTVSATNTAPTAAFTSTVANLAATFDASTSADADGSIASYAWSFGDGSTATGVTTSHTYAAAGPYSVTLTVTDDGGLATSVNHTVTVTAAPATSTTLAQDTFGRTTTSGWGSAETGGAWSATGTNYIVNNGTGAMVTASGTTRRNNLAGVSSSDVDATVQFSLDKDATGGGVYAGIVGRQVGSAYYQVRTRYLAGGTMAIMAMNGGSTLITNVNVAGLTVTPGTQLQMRVQVTGTSPTTIRAKLWKTGTTEPTAWTLSTTDNSAGLQSAGYVGIETYASASITNSPVTLRFDNLTYATTAGTTPVTPPVTPTNAAPTAAFTSTAANLTATFDGTTSTDTDGTIASYAWNYGDGATGTSATSSHTYAAGGTYTVTLTVADNGGATGTVSHTVTVTAPPAVPANVIAADTFMRTATNGWGTAETGGAWAMTSANANYFVSNGTGNLLVSAGGTRRGVLSALSSTATDVTVQVAADKAATGGGYYIGAVGRQVGTDYYQARIRFIAGGTVGLMLMHGPSTALSNTTVAGLTYTPGQQLNLRVQTTGTSPTTVRAKVWAVGTTEPASWTLSTTDNTAGLQAAGSAGVEAYLSGSATNAPLTVTYDNLQISTVQ